MTKYYVKNHATKTVIATNLTRKAAMELVKNSEDKKHVRMYALPDFVVIDEVSGEKLYYMKRYDAEAEAERRTWLYKTGYSLRHSYQEPLDVEFTIDANVFTIKLH